MLTYADVCGTELKAERAARLHALVKLAASVLEDMAGQYFLYQVYWLY